MIRTCLRRGRVSYTDEVLCTESEMAARRNFEVIIRSLTQWEGKWSSIFSCILKWQPDPGPPSRTLRSATGRNEASCLILEDMPMSWAPGPLHACLQGPASCLTSSVFQLRVPLTVSYFPHVFCPRCGPLASASWLLCRQPHQGDALRGEGTEWGRLRDPHTVGCR